MGYAGQRITSISGATEFQSANVSMSHPEVKSEVTGMLTLQIGISKNFSLDTPIPYPLETQSVDARGISESPRLERQDGLA